MLIACPFCGNRDSSEYRSGGATHIVRPGPAEEVTDAAWGDYLFSRDNPRGMHAERWHHAGGCGLWFNVLRDTASHEVRVAYALGDPQPELAQ